MILSSETMADSVNQKSTSKTRFYEYEPLKDGTAEIRLARLLYSHEDIEIRCEIATYSLDDLPPYCALSYECGSPGTEVEVFINGKVAYVRCNLVLLLNKYRELLRTKARSNVLCLNSPDGGYESLIWADALCINQSSAEEKKQQIPLLGVIFSFASHVCAWLGWTTTFDSRRLFAMIEVLAEYGSDLKSFDWKIFQISTISTGDAKKNFLNHQFEQLMSYKEGLTLEEFEKSFVKFLKLSFWSRRWPIQECLLGKNVTLLLDDHKLRWSTLMALWPHIERDRVSALFYDEVLGSTLYAMWTWTCDHVRQIREFRSSIQLRSYCSFMSQLDADPPLLQIAQLLKQFQNTVCELPCDLIYSLLNLTTGTPLVEANYDITPPGLFCQIISENIIIKYLPFLPLRVSVDLIECFQDHRWVAAIIDIAQALDVVGEKNTLHRMVTDGSHRVKFDALIHSDFMLEDTMKLLYPGSPHSAMIASLYYKLQPCSVASDFDRFISIGPTRKSSIRMAAQNLNNMKYWKTVLPVQGLHNLEVLLSWETSLLEVGTLEMHEIEVLKQMLSVARQHSAEISSLSWNLDLLFELHRRSELLNQLARRPSRGEFLDSNFILKKTGDLMWPPNSDHNNSETSADPELPLVPSPPFAVVQPGANMEYHHLTKGLWILVHRSSQGRSRIIQWVRGPELLVHMKHARKTTHVIVELDFSLHDFLRLVLDVHEEQEQKTFSSFKAMKDI